MALKVVSGNGGAPPIGRAFAASAARVLHDTDAPAGCKHLPAGVIFHGLGNFVWKDATGTTVTTVIAPADETTPVGVVGGFVPISPAELDATNAVAVTVFWHRGATK